MKSKIFSFVKITDDSIVASVRIARFLSQTLGIPLTWDASIADEPLDVLMIVNGAYAFAGNELLASLGEAIKSAERVLWIQNDYTVIPPKDEGGAESPFRKAFRIRHDNSMAATDYWTTVEPMSHPGHVSSTGYRLGRGSKYVNWNVLTTEDLPRKPFRDRSCPDRVLYYGSFRKDREKYFERYFRAPMIPMLFSCPTKKAEETFTSLMVLHETKLLDLYGYLEEFGAGLYLEDRKSHVEFHSPANRFYEMLSAHLPIIFQPESQRMMSRAGYEVGDYTIWSDHEQQRELYDRRELIGREQRSVWWEKVIAERLSLPDRVRQIWTDYNR